MTELVSEEAAGPSGLIFLNHFWSKVQLDKLGQLPPELRTFSPEREMIVFDLLGLPLESTLSFVYTRCNSFEEFDTWVCEGKPEQTIGQLNEQIRELLSESTTATDIGAESSLLTDEQHRFWGEHGYLRVEAAASLEDCQAAEEALWAHLGASREDESTWYREPRIMVNLYDHPTQDVLRKSTRIKQAFADLWGTQRITCSADRFGFNPPETEDWKFPGPDLHWDLEFSKSPRFRLQGLLYLTDTTEEQGALCLVPGFHHRFKDWLRNLPEGADPHQEDLHALGPVPIAGQAGDLIIWHQALPHGASPNRADKPRMVQYLTYQPIFWNEAATH